MHGSRIIRANFRKYGQWIYGHFTQASISRELRVIKDFSTVRACDWGTFLNQILPLTPDLILIID